jgi:hypothetical protein
MALDPFDQTMPSVQYISRPARANFAVSASEPAKFSPAHPSQP